MIEDNLVRELAGETLLQALALTSYLRDHGLPPVQVGENSWQVVFKEETICNMWLATSLEPITLFIWPYFDGSHETDTSQIDEHMKRIARQHVNPCTTGHCASNPGIRQYIFGQQFENICTAPIAFTNPSREEIDCIQVLLELRVAELSEM